MSTMQEEEEIINSLAVIQMGKLRANAHKPSWWDIGPKSLLPLLRAEVEELTEALDLNARPSDIKQECADIANIAAMIAAVADRNNPELGLCTCTDEEYSYCQVHI